MIYDLNGLPYQYFFPRIKTTNNACVQGQRRHTNTPNHKSLKYSLVYVDPED